MPSVNRQPARLPIFFYFLIFLSFTQMDPSKSLDHYANRRDLLRSYLEEYRLLGKEAPEVVAQLTFDGFVHFSFAYYRITEQTEGVERMEQELGRVRNTLLD